MAVIDRGLQISHLPKWLRDPEAVPDWKILPLTDLSVCANKALLSLSALLRVDMLLFIPTAAVLAAVVKALAAVLAAVDPAMEPAELPVATLSVPVVDMYLPSPVMVPLR